MLCYECSCIQRQLDLFRRTSTESRKTGEQTRRIGIWLKGFCR
jgi:hypothetical protein